MPDGLVLGAAAQVAGGGLNALSTGIQNNRSEKFSREMYDRQKADNLSFWNLQNDYNSPQAQMARFQEAGLNPNLIYGQGNSGNAGSVQTPDVQAVQRRSPEWGNALAAGGLTYMNGIYDLKIKQAQADNLREQTNVAHKEALLKDMDLATREFDLRQKADLKETNADYRRQELRKLETDTDLSIREDARRAIQSSTSVQEAAERILNLQQQRLNYTMQRNHTAADISRVRADTDRIRQQIDLMKKDGSLKDFEIKLRKDNISFHDPLWTRMVAKFFSDTTPETFSDYWKDFLRSGQENSY